MPDSDQEGRDLQDKGIERSKKIQPLPRNPVVVTVIAGGPVLVVDPDRRGRVVGALDHVHVITHGAQLRDAEGRHQQGYLDPVWLGLVSSPIW